MCGATIRLGDVMEVEYRTGREMKGGRIKGEVIELWSPELNEGHLQGRLSCGWCFHDSDRIISHVKRESANDKLCHAAESERGAQKGQSK